jgi:hypothetical protein
MDRPHWHPNARYVTVLQGTWYAGTGDDFDVKHAVPMPAGSFMVHPAGTTTPVNPWQPLWIEVSR